MGLTLDVSGASYRLPNGRMILDNVSFTLEAGQVLCILGPNGVGKSTLLRCIDGLESLASGRVLIEGDNVAHLGRAELGRRIGLVPQSDAPIFAFSVREMVEMGRAARLGWMQTPGTQDRTIVDATLSRLGIGFLADRLYPELSGGERQLVLIARALAQQPRLLILDEPTSHLDFANAMQVLELVRGLADEGLTVIMTTHNPDHAFLVADRTLAMAPGLPAEDGPTHALLTEQRLCAIYGRPIRIVRVEDRTICFAPADITPRPQSHPVAPARSA